jgi:hypothetical protein
MKRLYLPLIGLLVLATALLPALGPASQTATAQDGTGTQAQPPLVAVSPLAGPAGSTVQMVANGFPPNTNVMIGVGLVASEYDVLDRMPTDAQGTIARRVTIPVTAQTGTEWVIVVETEDLLTQAISYPFLVTASTGTGEVPTAVITPASGLPGDDLTLTASGFPPNVDVLIGVGRVQSEFNYSLAAQTDATGTVTEEIAIPGTAAPGSNWVALVEMEQNRDLEATSNIFTVEPVGGVTPTPPPDDALFESADIYLVALDDGGVSGIPVGCNDSLIPVTVTFEPTVAPLSAAFEELFAIDDQFYGQSGLYNAFYQSDITLDGIDISDAGLATINLSGTLTLGGACDAPRIQGQLRQTALQYGTVATVEVFLNGVPLQQVLDTAGGAQ